MLAEDLLHASFADEELDRLAGNGGFESGIGRLSLATDRVLDWFLSRMRERSASSVLDLGCGRGFLARWLQQRAPDVTYCGVDKSRVAIASAKRMLPHAKLVVADYTAISETADAVVIFDAFFRDSIDHVFAEYILSLVRPGGFFVLATTLLTKTHREIFEAGIASLHERSFDVRLTDWTDRVTFDALSYSTAWIQTPLVDRPFSLMIHREGREVIAAIRDREFSYLILEIAARL